MALPTITAVGNLVFDPEFRATSSGISMCKMRIACNERKKADDGTWSDSETSYFDIIAWRNLAEAAAESFTKGQAVVVIGKVRITKYEDKNGIERTIAEIIAEEIAVVAKSSKKAQIAPESDPWL